MTKRDTAIIGAPCWVDLMTSDTERSRQFYCDLFGWEAEDPNPEFGGYFNFTKDGVRVAGGMGSSPDDDTPEIWTIYLATDDAAKTLEAVTANGGKVTFPAMQIAELGTMAVIEDASGAHLGIWQPGTHQGFGYVEEAGAPSWFELHTRDYDTAVNFYRSTFAWDTNVVGDSPEFRYTTLVQGEQPLAGIMDASAFLPEGVPSEWKVYFGTDDTDATLARIVELGGSIVEPAEDTPYGRLATATDSVGASFRLVSPNLKNPQ